MFYYDVSDQIIVVLDPKFDVSGLFFVWLLWSQIFCVFLHRFSKVRAMLSGICNPERREV